MRHFKKNGLICSGLSCCTQMGLLGWLDSPVLRLVLDDSVPRDVLTGRQQGSCKCLLWKRSSSSKRMLCHVRLFLFCSHALYARTTGGLVSAASPPCPRSLEFKILLQKLTQKRHTAKVKQVALRYQLNWIISSIIKRVCCWWNIPWQMTGMVCGTFVV